MIELLTLLSSTVAAFFFVSFKLLQLLSPLSLNLRVASSPFRALSSLAVSIASELSSMLDVADVEHL
uniref:Putative ovule protein n=1 Tax=Solanum chacoense TaxID=4108 RepID=A0A0V0GJ43_SOLCH